MVSGGGGGETRVDMKESLWKDSTPHDDNDNRTIPVIEKRFWTRRTKHVIPPDQEHPEVPSQPGMRDGDHYGEGLLDGP
jgi:hypothetical protein